MDSHSPRPRPHSSQGSPVLGPVTNTRLLEPPVLKAESEAKQRRLESQGAYIQKLVEERGQREAELSEARTGAELQAQRIVHLQQVRFMCTKISLNATEGQASCLIAACFVYRVWHSMRYTTWA